NSLIPAGIPLSQLEFPYPSWNSLIPAESPLSLLEFPDRSWSSLIAAGILLSDSLITVNLLNTLSQASQCSIHFCFSVEPVRFPCFTNALQCSICPKQAKIPYQ